MWAQVQERIHLYLWFLAEGSGNVDVRVTAEHDPNKPEGTTSYINRYWTIDNVSLSDTFSTTVTCTYLPGDVVGAGTLYAYQYANGEWSDKGDEVTNNSFIMEDVTSFGTFTAMSDQNPVDLVDPGTPTLNNGMMINDSTDFHTYTSWRNEIDDGPADSIDSDEGFEPNQLEGIGLMLDSLITFDVSVGSVANGEYSMGAGATDSGIMYYDGEYNVTSPEAGGVGDGEYDADSRNEYIGGASDNTQEFNAEYDGIADLTFNFDGEYIINHEAIAAYEDRHPLFKTELDLLLEKF